MNIGLFKFVYTTTLLTAIEYSSVSRYFIHNFIIVLFQNSENIYRANTLRKLNEFIYRARAAMKNI